jgi:hypothetical protein
MFRDHYSAMVAAYAVSLGGFLVARRVLDRLWPAGESSRFAAPWREFALAMAGAIGILLVGQLWSRGIRLPEEGALGPLLGAINQALIFAPVLLVPILRRHPAITAWLPSRRIPQRLLVGVVLAVLAVAAYSSMREGAENPWSLLGRIWSYDHLDEAVQVFLEDVAIAILFVRLAAAIGYKRATVIVAALFAAGHIPAMLSVGISRSELIGLTRDAALGAAVILVLQRSRDVLWFWSIHFSLDMAQFPDVSGIG